MNAAEKLEKIKKDHPDVEFTLEQSYAPIDYGKIYVTAEYKNTKIKVWTYKDSMKDYTCSFMLAVESYLRKDKHYNEAVKLEYRYPKYSQMDYLTDIILQEGA